MQSKSSPQDGQPTPPIPDDVRAAIVKAFPNQQVGPATPTFGGYSNLTVALPIDGRQLVAKIAHTAPKRSDVRREARILTALQESGLPIPKLVQLIESESFTIELLQHIDGTNAMRFFSAEVETLPALYAAVGRTLGATHQRTLAEHAPDFDLLPRYQQAQAAISALDLAPQIAGPLHAALTHPVWQRSADRLVHGDAGLHNILWDVQLRALLDWEWAGRGLPLLDLAWTAWIMRFRSLDPALWDGFLTAYRSVIDQPPVATADELRALALGQIAFILTRTDPDTWARGEWERRAEATLQFTFPTIE